MKNLKRSQEGEFSCLQCGSKFATLQALGGHKSVHTGKKKPSSDNPTLQRFRLLQYQFPMQSLSDSALPPAKRSRLDFPASSDHPVTSSMGPSGSSWLQHLLHAHLSRTAGREDRLSPSLFYTPYSTNPSPLNTALALLPLSYSTLPYLQAQRQARPSVALPDMVNQYANSAPNAHKVLSPLSKGHVAAQRNSAHRDKTGAEFFLEAAAKMLASSLPASHQVGEPTSPSSLNFQSNSDSLVPDAVESTSFSGAGSRHILPAEPARLGREHFIMRQPAPQHQNMASWRMPALEATERASTQLAPSKHSLKRDPPSCGLNSSAIMPRVSEKLDLTLRLSLV